ncbi:MAG: hypothetical protein AW09_004562 [Candidatus Accumulibacter phosphatis]|uniref:Uncharacterized protein n=1 Tax=Candidatus Accumulibacter phosphatis TaxID=327160 RepID=A0A084Y6K1_9PROT|nr:MAG: hypothetical protein AW09_004562 [Candidatus Accumulibacter phosphatis]
MQPGPAAVERNANLATRQVGQLIQGQDFRGTCVGGRQDAQARSRLAIGAHCGHGFEDVKQLAHPGVGDEADQDVNVIAGCQFAAQFGQQRG